MHWIGLAFFIFLSSISHAQTECEISVSGKVFDLTETVQGHAMPGQLLQLLSHFKASQEIVKEIGIRMERSEIQFVSMRTARFENVSTKNPLAMFDVVEEMPTIFLGKNELGILVVHLFHEAVHASDEQYLDWYAEYRNAKAAADAEFETMIPLSNKWKAWDKAFQTRELNRHRNLFAAERKAYTAQHALIQEMSARYQCAKEYFQSRHKQGRIFAEALPDEAIYSLYDLIRQR